jgi:hypothetical protein
MSLTPERIKEILLQHAKSPAAGLKRLAQIMGTDVKGAFNAAALVAHPDKTGSSEMFGILKAGLDACRKANPSTLPKPKPAPQKKKRNGEERPPFLLRCFKCNTLLDIHGRCPLSTCGNEATTEGKEKVPQTQEKEEKEQTCSAEAEEGETTDPTTIPLTDEEVRAKMTQASPGDQIVCYFRKKNETKVRFWEGTYISGARYAQIDWYKTDGEPLTNDEGEAVIVESTLPIPEADCVDTIRIIVIKAEPIPEPTNTSHAKQKKRNKREREGTQQACKDEKKGHRAETTSTQTTTQVEKQEIMDQDPQRNTKQRRQKRERETPATLRSASTRRSHRTEERNDPRN